MTKDLAYYMSLPYEREWLPRDDESGRYFAVRLKAIPEIYGTGYTKQAALAALRRCFDDQIAWCIEEGVAIPEPDVNPAQPGRTYVMTMERIPVVTRLETVLSCGEAQATTRTAEVVDSFRPSRPIGVADLQVV